MSFECPECERAILNRKINKCLYCGATLPDNLLLSPEKIAEMNTKDLAKREQKRPHIPTSSGGNSGSVFDLCDAIDIAVDIGGLFD